MAKKNKLLKDLEKDAVEQEDKRYEVEETDNIEGNELDPEKAPAVEAMDELEDKWGAMEKDKELEETSEDEDPDVDSSVDEEEEKGEEPYPEIEEELNREDITDSEREADEEEEEEEKEGEY